MKPQGGGRHHREPAASMWEAERGHSSDFPFISLLGDLLWRSTFRLAIFWLTQVSVSTVESSPIFSERLRKGGFFYILSEQAIKERLSSEERHRMGSWGVIGSGTESKPAHSSG